MIRIFFATTNSRNFRVRRWAAALIAGRIVGVFTKLGTHKGASAREMATNTSK